MLKGFTFVLLFRLFFFLLIKIEQGLAEISMFRWIFSRSCAVAGWTQKALALPGLPSSFSSTHFQLPLPKAGQTQPQSPPQAHKWTGAFPAARWFLARTAWARVSVQPHFFLPGICMESAQPGVTSAKPEQLFWVPKEAEEYFQRHCLCYPCRILL